MHQYKLFDFQGSGEEIFCRIMQLAIDDLVQKDFAANHHSTKFKIDPLLVTRAYERIKAVNFNGTDGQQLQEFLITSILKYYLEIYHPESTYQLAFPNDKSVDSILIESEKDMPFKTLGNKKVMPTRPVTVYHFQVKEVREEGDLIKDISKDISEAKDERLHQSTIFQKFTAYFNKRIRERDYGGTILLLFLRAPSYMAFNTKELIEEFTKLNDGYFKSIWFVAAVEKLVDKGGKDLAISQKPGMNFHWYIKELINSESDSFVVVNMGCSFKLIYEQK